MSTYSIRKKYPLETAYISLSVNDEDFEYEDDISGISEYQIHGNLGSRIEDFISYGDHFVIFGSPGSGKTTLLQWLMIKIVQNDLPRSIEHFSNYKPIFIRMRSVSDLENKNFLDAAKESSPHLFNEIDTKWLHKKADDGQILFLIDGIDEIPKNKRSSAIEWIDNLYLNYEQCKFIITSRPIEETGDFSYSFRSAYLQKMTIDDIRRFIVYWHRAVLTGVFDKDITRRIDSSREKLLDAVINIEGIRNLATNPLLCAVICTINLDRNCNVPRDRSEIYQASIDLLLNRRDTERNIASKVYSEIAAPKRRKIFQEIARWMAINERYVIDKDKLASCVFAEVECEDPELRKELLSAFVERSGLLREISTDQIDFIHKQFQEYLAAESFVDEDDIGLLAEKAKSDAWKELIVLSCGKMNKSQANHFMNSVIDQLDISAGQTRRRGLISSVIFGEFCSRLEPRIDEELIAFREEVFPPKDASEVSELAILGSKFITLIRKSGALDDSAATLCARALIEIGGEESLTILGNLAEHAGRKTLDQIVSGWEYFQSEEYGERVITNLAGTYEISWVGKSDLKGLIYAENARKIALVSCEFDSDLECIPFSNTLTKLEIEHGEYLNSTKGISTSKNLETLTMIGCEGLEAVEDLEDLQSLKILDLRGCTRITDLSSLGRCWSLEEIYLDGLCELESIDFVRSLENLRIIHLDEIYGVKDWRAFEALKKLKEIKLIDISVFDDFDLEFRNHVDLI